MNKQVTWIVMKNDVEITRCKTQKMANIIASEIGGLVVKYVKG